MNFLRPEQNGYYTLRKYNADTNELVQEIGPFKNKITNIGLNRVGNNTADGSIYVGTGTNPSSYTDTSMGVFKARTGAPLSSRISPVAPDYIASTLYVGRFAAGAISGNITEVGIGWTADSVNGLWSRELIVDESGNPVTLTVLPNEYLDVIYTLQLKPNLNDFTGSFVLGGVTYNYTGRPAFITAWRTSLASASFPTAGNAYAGASCALGPVTGTITGNTDSRSPFGSQVADDYVDGSLTLAGTTNFLLTDCNMAGGIRAFMLSSRANEANIINQWQILLDKSIPKTNEITFSLTIGQSWNRYAP